MAVGLQERGGNGPAAKRLFDAHTDAVGDLGHAKAAELSNYRMEQQQKYSLPVGGQENSLLEASKGRPDGPPSWYNSAGMQPAKYDMPTVAKERMLAHQAVRRAAGEALEGAPGIMRVDPIGPEEIDYTMAMKQQAELANFDRYVNALIDPKKPGNLKWLMEVYPEFVHRRVAQVHDDFDFATSNQMIDHWGINTIDDLHFKYLVDQGKISGGKLLNKVYASELYQVGSLAPWANRILKGQRTKDTGDVYMPYHSEKPRRAGTGWVQSGDNQPLGEGERDYYGLAKRVFAGEEPQKYYGGARRPGNSGRYHSGGYYGRDQRRAEDDAV